MQSAENGAYEPIRGNRPGHTAVALADILDLPAAQCRRLAEAGAIA